MTSNLRWDPRVSQPFLLTPSGCKLPIGVLRSVLQHLLLTIKVECTSSRIIIHFQEVWPAWAKRITNTCIYRVIDSSAISRTVAVTRLHRCLTPPGSSSSLKRLHMDSTIGRNSCSSSSFRWTSTRWPLKSRAIPMVWVAHLPSVWSTRLATSAITIWSAWT